MTSGKKRWEMTDKERETQDNRTMLLTFFVIVPLILIGFFLTMYLSELIWKNIDSELLVDIGRLPILILTGLVIFSLGTKIFERLNPED